MRAAVVAALLAASGCGEELGPRMRPGEDCLSCHSAGGGASHVWTAAGTVYPSDDAPSDAGLGGVTVLLTDALGKSVSLTSNGAGNFYTAEPLAFPLARAAVTRGGATLEMTTADLARGGGSCNGCHTRTGEARWRLRAP